MYGTIQTQWGAVPAYEVAWDRPVSWMEPRYFVIDRVAVAIRFPNPDHGEAGRAAAHALAARLAATNARADGLRVVDLGGGNGR